MGFDFDFFQVCTREGRGGNKGKIEVYPDFTVGRSRDLMVRGNAFYAVWDPEKGLWSTDEYDVQRFVDQAVLEKAEELRSKGVDVEVKLMRSNNSGCWNQYKKYIKNAVDNSHQLDMKLTFSNTKVEKSDYVSRRLPYALEPGDHSSWDELLDTLYSPEEREKIEWSIGSVIEGDSKKIQKFMVFYGSPGTGKSTVMNIIEMLFEGYVARFEAKELVGTSNSFATAAFASNPLVAIQHDGDLSRVEDNSKLNSIVAHEIIRINEKYKSAYEARINAFLFMGTNKPVHITDAKSGLIRRLIDVVPTGNTLDADRYYFLMDRIPFELGAIAHHCREVYRRGGKNRYNTYRPESMLLKTNPFYNFVEDNFDIFRKGHITLKQAWELYKEWSEDSEMGYKLQRYKFREELKNYFEEFHDRYVVDGVPLRSVYVGFSLPGRFKKPVEEEQSKGEEKSYELVLDETVSILDEMYAGLPAQYANARGYPQKYWDDSERLINGVMKKPSLDQVVDTVLGDLDTSKLHYLKVPENHIVIDFDLKDENGEKSLEANLKAASVFPPTYAELSKSGKGVHLHYVYDGGDPTKLDPNYAPGIEVKVFHGNSSLRRKLTKCNGLPVATLRMGLGFKEEKKVLRKGTLKSEKGLRDLIERNLRKEIHPGTKPSVDFIKHILDEAYEAGYPYDVSDMRPRIMAFANNSTNQAAACLKAVAQMKFKSENAPGETPQEASQEGKPKDDRIVFFDCEVYPNLFAVCWKYHGSPNTVRMINPSSDEIERLLDYKLVGFNNREYDNHILWARLQGANNQQLYELSQKIINNERGAKFGLAYDISYADVYDFAATKQTLKKWQHALKIRHMEMDIPWDQPVPPEKIQKVLDYCANDVESLEAVFEHLEGDFEARKILAKLSGLSVNNTTRQHATRIIFGHERRPQSKFVYTDLSELFPGYEFNEFAKTDKSTYRGEVVGEGGYVYAEPGIYQNVALLDVESMHPTSIEELNLFGPYTAEFSRLKKARLAIKHAGEHWSKGRTKEAEECLAEGRELLPGIEVNQENTKALSDALKLVINSVYGYTSAKFDNPFRDPRNKDNIVAKRGALFMIELKHTLQEMGVQVIHIKTDSVKIPNATTDIIEFVKEFGARYGYTFNHETTYERMCLVNDAVYIAKTQDGEWTATGAEFKHPYVFKYLFAKEPITFDDLCELKQVKKGYMVLRYPEGDKVVDLEDQKTVAPGENGDTHIGRSGLFVPINPMQDILQGGELLCIRDGKEYAVAGTKGWLWAEAELVRTLQDGAIERLVFEPLEVALEGTGSIADVIDMAYFAQLAEDAAQSIEKFGSFEEFIS